MNDLWSGEKKLDTPLIIVNNGGLFDLQSALGKTFGFI